jgi:hypothetical protein
MKTNEQKAKEVVDAICRDLQKQAGEAQTRQWYGAYLAWKLDGKPIKPVQE